MSPPGSEEPALRFVGVSKSYSRDLRRAQRNGLSAIFDEVRGHEAPSTELRTGEFWALDDVTFDVEQGQAVGVLGRNGAGKSTLMRVAAGITQPTVGEVHRRGTIGVLLDPNAGFDPILTGRENVEVAYALLGGEQPDAATVDAVFRYADVADAADHPVRTYSQGMRLRLGFSVMVHVDPDVLIIDEALAVGDTAFQLQCLDHLLSYLRAGGSLLFVSHSLWLYQHLATSGVHLENGRAVLVGATDEVADHYVAALQRGAWVDGGEGPDIMDRELGLLPASAPEVVDAALEGASEDLAGADGAGAPAAGPSASARAAARPVRFRSVEVSGPDGTGPVAGGDLEVAFHLEAARAVDQAELAFSIWTADLWVCVAADMNHDVDGRPGTATIALGEGPASFRCTVHDLPLDPGPYAVRAVVYDAPTDEILGMIGIEDQPVWFDVRGPVAAAEDPEPAHEAIDEPDDAEDGDGDGATGVRRAPTLRSLRHIEAGPIRAVPSG